jgi:hypothetical protein
MLDDKQSDRENEETPASPDTRGPILVQLVRDDTLSPFEVETLKISRRTYWISVFAFAAAVVAAYLVGSQFIEMKDQTQILASQAQGQAASASVSAVQVQQQLGIAQQQAKAAQDSVTAIQRQMRQDQRPWMRFDMGDSKVNPTVSVKVGSSLVVPVRMTNVGKTPAERLQMFFVIEVVPLGKDPHLPKHHFIFDGRRTKPNPLAAYRIRVGAMFPESHVDEMVPRLQIKNGTVVENFLSVPEANDVVNGKAYLAVFGEVSYFDVFGFRHWTKFCKDGFPDGSNPNNGKCANFYAVDNN